MKKLRILQFITPAGFYGAERWILALVNNSDSPDVIHHLAVTKESDTQDLAVAERFPAKEGKVHYLPMHGRFDLSVVKKLTRIIKEEQIDIIHTHGYKSDIIGLIAARISGISALSTPHGFSGKVNFKLGLYIKLGTSLLRYFDAVVPLSDELVKDIQKFKVPGNKIHFIRNGVDLREIDVAISEKQPLDDGIGVNEPAEKIIGFVGQMIPRKGIEELLHVFDALYASNKTIRLQLLGDGVQRSELEFIAANLASSREIEFLGFQERRLELLSRFSLFVMTSSLEGIPRCMMEAMAVGVPVVAYDIPGVDQLIEHGVTGLLAPYGDRGALQKCCEQILEDSELAKKLVENARNKVHAVYSAARMADEYSVLFRKLVSE